MEKQLIEKVQQTFNVTESDARRFIDNAVKRVVAEAGVAPKHALEALKETLEL